MIDRYPDGVWLVKLGPLTDTTLVPHTVGAVLELREMPDQPILDALVSMLRGCRVLLVIENYEHLLEACAQLVDVLLQACPNLQVLATSREGGGPGLL